VNRRGALSDEDRVLWTLVARSTRPLKGRAAAADTREPAETMADLLGERPVATSPAPAKAASAKPHLPQQSALDRPTHDKLARGRLPIEARVDLHGLTQSEAHGLLLSFLGRAHARGVRYVLVITGKGSSSGGEGVLRRAVPGWLGTPQFRALVSGHDNAARNHGGEGALYLRLRRPKVAT